MWDLKYDTDELMYKIETDSRQRIDLLLPRGRAGGGGMDWKFQIGREKLAIQLSSLIP